MMKEDIKDLIGRRIFVVLKSGRNYTGTIESIEDKLVHLTDKFNLPVYFSIEDISSLEVKG